MKEAIAAFWRDFQGRKLALEKLETADDPAYDQVLASLQNIDPHLYFEFCSTPGENEFIVTAEGEKRLFPLVEEIVRAAPDLPDWRIFALKPRRGFPVAATWEQTEVEIDEVVVVPVFRETGEMGLRLYVPNLSESNQQEIHNALLRALDAGLGEKRFAESIAATWVYPAADAPEHSFPLAQLDAYLDRRNMKG
jgi:hypothetical protein